MSLLKNIVGRVMAVWALLSFAITLIIFLPTIALSTIWPEPKRSKYTYIFYSAWMATFFVLSGVRRVFLGREHFAKGQNYVVVCNHRSLLDPPLSSPGIPSPNKTIAKAEMAKIPIFGIMYKHGSVLVDRKSEESRRASFMKMKQVLDWGLHMCIYPEGTRNKTTEPLQRFHDGAFKLAIDANKQIIPALLFNTANVLPSKGFFFWPGKVEMHFLPPVKVEGRKSQEVKEEVFSAMKTYYQLHSAKLQ